MRITVYYLLPLLLLSCKEDCVITPRHRDLRNSFSAEWQRLTIEEIISVNDKQSPSAKFLPTLAPIVQVKDQAVFDSIHRYQYRFDHQLLDFRRYSYFMVTAEMSGAQVLKDLYVNHNTRELIYFYRSQVVECKSGKRPFNFTMSEQFILRIPKLADGYKLSLQYE